MVDYDPVMLLNGRQSNFFSQGRQTKSVRWMSVFGVQNPKQRQAITVVLSNGRRINQTVQTKNIVFPGSQSVSKSNESKMFQRYICMHGKLGSLYTTPVPSGLLGDFGKKKCLGKSSGKIGPNPLWEKAWHRQWLAMCKAHSWRIWVELMFVSEQNGTRI